MNRVRNAVNLWWDPLSGTHVRNQRHFVSLSKYSAILARSAGGTSRATTA
jgi:hypothetical protein